MSISMYSASAPVFLRMLGNLDKLLEKAEAQGIAAIVCSVNRLHDEAVAYGWKAMELAPNTGIMHTPLAYALAHADQGDDRGDTDDHAVDS